MYGHLFPETHHEDITSKWFARITFVIILLCSAFSKSRFESGRTEKKVFNIQAVIDSLNKEIEWRQKVIAHHDLLKALVKDNKYFLKLPREKR